jgi:hypothetical protein
MMPVHYAAHARANARTCSPGEDHGCNYDVERTDARCRSRRKGPAEAGLSLWYAEGRVPSAVTQFGDAGAVSVTTIRISTCDFWATNKALSSYQSIGDRGPSLPRSRGPCRRLASSDLQRDRGKAHRSEISLRSRNRDWSARELCAAHTGGSLGAAATDQVLSSLISPH